MDTNRKPIPKLRFVIGCMFLVFLWGCSINKAENFFEDQIYLTPIPETTLAAYRDEMPITNKLEAVVAAQMFMRTTRIKYEELPRVISVEELELTDAQHRMRDPESENYYYEDRPGNTIVWLILLEGDFRIVPPVSDYTPEPFVRGCAYVLIDKNGRGEMSTTKCPD
jgi:hypothetical protein